MDKESKRNTVEANGVIFKSCIKYSSLFRISRMGGGGTFEIGIGEIKNLAFFKLTFLKKQ